MQSNYKRNAEENAHNSMAITVEGRQVALHFADEPNPQVAEQVRQALLSCCFPAKK